MSAIENRMENMLFDYETTNRTDFRGGQITVPTLTKYKPKQRCLSIRPPPLKNLHTLTPWKTTSVPFSLMHSRKPITRTDPTKVQEAYVKPPDLEKEQSIKTRPRLVMTPAVSMDDVTNKRARAILCDSMYTSNMTRATREAISDYFTVKAPLPGLPAPANPIKLPRPNLPYVSPEWRMDTVSWDNNQLRTYCDSTKEFWLSHKLPPMTTANMGQKDNNAKMFEKIPQVDKKYQTLLFSEDFKTTYLDSYRAEEYSSCPSKKIYRIKQKKPRPDLVPLKNLNTLTPYKPSNMLPFDLYYKPDPIIRKDPNRMQQQFEPPLDENRIEVQKTRPKVIMTPAIDLDKFEEPSRKLLVDNIYLSQTARALKEGLGPARPVVKAPLPYTYSHSRPIFIKRLTEQYVSPEWRMESVSWDSKQLRADVDPTKTFWH